jgi:hypothetical protein
VPQVAPQELPAVGTEVVVELATTDLRARRRPPSDREIWPEVGVRVAVREVAQAKMKKRRVPVFA